MKRGRIRAKEDKNLVAYCGLYCGACSFKVAYDENNKRHILEMPAHYDQYKDKPLKFCPGCKFDEQGSECKMRDCAKNRGLGHCGLCEDFPCEIINKFSGDGVLHHSEVIKSLMKLKDIGEDQWLRLQEQKWHCECGAKISWYVKICFKCGRSLKVRD